MKRVYDCKRGVWMCAVQFFYPFENVPEEYVWQHARERCKEYLRDVVLDSLRRIVHANRLDEKSAFMRVGKKFQTLDLSCINMHGERFLGRPCEEICALLSRILSRIPTLTQLSLKGSDITTLAGFEQLKSLTKLNLGHCYNVKSLPKRFDQLALKELDLGWCKALDMDKEINKIVEIKTLEKLSMDATNISSLTERFEQLKNLTSLDLRYCGSLVSLPKRFGQLEKLEELTLTECTRLETLPESFCGLQALKTLKLDGSFESMAIRALPERFGQLQKLEELILTNCRRLETLPESFCGLQALKTLKLNSLFASLAIQALPERFDQLDLKELNLYLCKALDMDKEIIKVIEMKNLEKLNIACTNISVLPKRIGELGTLTSLNLSYCHSLNSLPERFDQLKLVELTLGQTPLDGSEDTYAILSRIPTLTKLSLKGSDITTLPERFDQLKSLTSLNLEWCDKLESLPKRFDQLKNLKMIDLCWCPAGSNLPPTVRAQLESQGCTILD